MIFLTKLIFQFPLDGFLFSFPNLSLDDFPISIEDFFPTTPSLLHKEGSTSIPSPSSLGGRGKPLLLVALNRFALR